MFLAHLAQRAKVSYWDCAVSGVVHCPSSVDIFFSETTGWIFTKGPCMVRAVFGPHTIAYKMCSKMKFYVRMFKKQTNINAQTHFS